MAIALRATLLVSAAMLAACGGGSALAVRGATVDLRTAAPFARQQDFPARIESTIDAALRYWGGSWADLGGLAIVLVDDAQVPCGGSSSALGCYEERLIRMTTRDPGTGTFACIEETVLVHEIGHAVIGDPLHQDPRWMEMDEVALELEGRTGYGAAGEVPCVIYPSVWRHPLGTP